MKYSLLLPICRQTLITVWSSRYQIQFYSVRISWASGQALYQVLWGKPHWINDGPCPLPYRGLIISLTECQCLWKQEDNFPEPTRKLSKQVWPYLRLLRLIFNILFLCQGACCSSLHQALGLERTVCRLPLNLSGDIVHQTSGYTGREVGRHEWKDRCQCGFFQTESLTLTVAPPSPHDPGLTFQKMAYKAELFNRPCISLSLWFSMLKGALTLFYGITSAWMPPVMENSSSIV